MLIDFFVQRYIQYIQFTILIIVDIDDNAIHHNFCFLY